MVGVDLQAWTIGSWHVPFVSVHHLQGVGKFHPIQGQVGLGYIIYKVNRLISSSCTKSKPFHCWVTV